MEDHVVFHDAHSHLGGGNSDYIDFDAPLWVNYLHDDDDDDDDDDEDEEEIVGSRSRPHLVSTNTAACFVSGHDDTGEQLTMVQVFMNKIGARAAYGFEDDETNDLYYLQGHDVLLAHDYVAALRTSFSQRYTRSCLNKLHPHVAGLAAAVLSTRNGYAYKRSRAIQIIAVANFLARRRDGYYRAASNQNKLNRTLVITGHNGSGKSTMHDHLSFLLDTLDANLMDGIQREYPEMDIREVNFARISEKLRAGMNGGANVTSKMVSKKYHDTLLDIPSHGDSLNKMIEAALDGDYAIVNIDCSILDFECSSGQLIEHASIVHALDVKHLICTFNKMDATVPPFSKNKFEELREKVQLLMVNVGFNPDHLQHIPVSGLYGENLTTMSIHLHWFTGPTLLESINNSITKTKNESHKPPRDTVALLVKDLNVNDTKVGHVASNPDVNPATGSPYLIGRVFILNSGQIRRGFTPVLKCHTLSTEVEFTQIISRISPRSGELIEKRPGVLSRGDAAFVKMVLREPIVVEAFDEFQYLRRFVLTEEDQIVAVGVIQTVGMI